MKKFIRKFWGLALIVVLLSSMFIGSAAPASAGTLSFTVSANPDDVIGGITSAATVNDFVVAADGSTAYAATTAGIMKSLDGGKTWGLPVVPFTSGGATTDFVAACPDNPNFVVVMDATGAGATTEVALSVNGGSTWSSLGAPRSAAAVANTAVTGIDVSPTVAGTNYIGVSGSTAGGPALFYFTYGITIPGWMNATADAPFPAYVLAGGETVFTGVKFTPNFAADYICLVVSDDNGTGAGAYYLHAASFNVFKFDAAIPTYLTYPVAFNAATGANAIVNTDIVMDPLYYGGDSLSRIAYIGINAGAVAASAVYRCTDVTPTNIQGTTQVRSIDINADGSKLIVGQVINNNVISIAGPSTVFPAATNTRTTKRLGITSATDNMIVQFAGANIYAAKASTLGAFAVSTDGGLTFNSISLVNIAAAAIVDQVVSPDGTKRFVMLDNGANTALFYYDGASWVNTFCVAGAGGFVLAPSPDTFETLYIGDVTGLTIYYSPDGGMTNWYTRAAPSNGAGTIVDIEALNDSTIYSLTAFGGSSKVSKSTNNGFIWTTMTTPFAAAGASLTLVAEDQLIAGSAAGGCSYTTDNGLVWWPLAALAAGNVYTTADGLAAGSNIYGVTAADNIAYRWTIGVNTTAWSNIGAGTAGYLSTGVALYNGTLYRIGANATDTEIARYLSPTDFIPGFALTDTSTSLLATIAGVTTGNVGPNAVKVSTGNQLWMANSTGFDVTIYTDSLADPATVPVLQSPADASLVQVNNLTGIPYTTTFMFSDASLAGLYQIQVAWDEDFTQIAVTDAGVPFVIGGPQLYAIGPGVGTVAGTSTTVVYQPGQTMYWRARAVAPFFSNWSEVYSFSIMPGQAMVPDISSPENGSVVDTVTPGFSWTPIGGATTYRFELSDSSEFSTIVYTADPTTAGVSLPASVTLDRGGQYFWRVKALTPTEGEWSTVANFVVAEPVVTPEPTTPAPVVTPTVTVEIPPATTTVIEVPPATSVTNEVNPSYIWAIICIGAVLVIAVIVLIVRTRRSV